MSTHHRQIVLAHGELRYIIRKRRGHRSFTLSVHEDGKVLLTIPKWSSVREAERFVATKQSWLEKVYRPTAVHVDHQHARKQYEEHRETARAFVQKRLAELNTSYGVLYKRISIRHNKSRWGSCSSTGNLSFDYRILFLPAHLQDYLLVHELCHLHEMNHGRRFWNHVERTIPEYRAHRTELRAIERVSLVPTT